MHPRASFNSLIVRVVSGYAKKICGWCFQPKTYFVVVRSRAHLPSSTSSSRKLRNADQMACENDVVLAINSFHSIPFVSTGEIFG
jgi:hypothetical protein